MIAMLDFAALAIATMFALTVASGLTWIVLYVALAFMQPAKTRKPASRAELGHGTTQLARAFATNR